jgi:6-phosphogluconolactonase (cycloisomerase 2 family)
MDVINEENGGSISVFDVSKGGAKLKGIKGSPFLVTCPGFCDANPSVAVGSGSYLYTVDEYGWYVSAFSVGSHGALTELDSYATGDGPNDAAMTPKGTYMYVTNGVQANVSAYGVASGVLTQLAGSPFPAGNQPDSIVITPDGKYAYVANSGDGTISGYGIGGGGTLRQLSGSPFADGSDTAPGALTTDAQGKHLFVANANAQNIAVYAIGGSGALSQIEGSPFAERSGASGPKGLAIYR